LMLDVLFGKADLRPGRLVASAIVFGLLFLALTMFWQPVRRGLGWLLLPLGQHALYAYTAHVAVTAAVALFLKPLDLPHLAQPGLNAVLQVASVLLIWSLVRFKVLAPTQSTMRWWSLSPLPIALALAVILPRDPSPTHPGMGPEPDQPAPERARVARAFGTPIPRTGSGPPPPPAPRAAQGAPTSPATGATPGPVATPMPLPTPERARRPLQGGEPAVSEYVGPIEGALRRFAFYSPALNADVEYFIYLPPDYSRAGRRYPVLYMLHGAAGDKDEWVAEGLIDAADRAIESGELRPMLIVLPDGDMSYWVNHARGGLRWGDYLGEDLVRHIDASYRTLPEPSARAVGGLSMGAWGALHQGLTRPDVFGTVGAHSPALRDNQGWLAFLGDGEEFARKDPLSLVRTAESIEDLQIWIDLGEEDPWLERTELLHDALTEREIKHDWHVLPGGHDGDYWRENTLNYLRFYEGALNPR
jgi:enterochelin esterase-like enzyme